jgi:hypothetical protein
MKHCICWAHVYLAVLRLAAKDADVKLRLKWGSLLTPDLADGAGGETVDIGYD